MGYFYTILADPQALFLFPKENFKLWIIVMALYPVLSVIPQEFVYRVFFFQRYKTIFDNNFKDRAGYENIGWLEISAGGVNVERGEVGTFHAEEFFV